MKKLFSILFLLIFALHVSLFTLHSRVLANGAGLPAFFKINDKLAISNPLQQLGITASSFLIPQDFAPESYISGTPINFVVDEKLLKAAFTPQFTARIEYDWDFGDGSDKVKGLTFHHTYAKPGSYFLILTINMYSADSQTPTQFIDSFFINITPDKNFKDLPQAHILVNGASAKTDTTTGVNENVFDVNLNQPVQFDASSSTGKEIIEYLWNFGDGQTADGKTVTHTYKSTDLQIVVLRIKDKTGFTSEDYIGLRHGANAQQKVIDAVASGKPTSVKKTDSALVPIVIGSILIVVVSIGAFMILRKKS